eukprot:1559855-Alexandrium_andersonii.AAC.1
MAFQAERSGDDHDCSDEEEVEPPENGYSLSRRIGLPRFRNARDLGGRKFEPCLATPICPSWT